MNEPTGRRRAGRWRDELATWRAPLRRDLKRCRRLLTGLRKDLAQAEQADALRTAGEVLKTRLYAVPPGAREVTLDAPWLPEGSVVVQLRRELSAKANMERIFRRARGFARAQPGIRGRIEATERRIAELSALRDRLTALLGADEDVAVEPETIAALRADLQAAGVRRATVDPRAATAADRKRLRKGERRLPPGIHRFVSARGAEVLAGRSAAANDVLVTRLARGRDVWLHTRDRPGAHVLLRIGRRDEAPDSRDLLECAILAAHLSGFAKGDRADVTWTRAKHVRKPKRAAPGLVLISSEKTLLVTVAAEVVDAWYARREQSA